MGPHPPVLDWGYEMRTLSDDSEDADVSAMASAVLMYGIVGLILGTITLGFVFFCPYCNVMSPFSCIVSGLALYRGAQVLPRLQQAKMDDTQCIVGVVFGVVGFLLGLGGLLVTLFMGCAMSVYAVMFAAILST